MKKPPCFHCHTDAKVSLVTGVEVYPHRPDLAEKLFYRCECGASVGCHPCSLRPLGYPANKETRRARMKLHAKHLDPIWKEAPQKLRKKTRSAAYGFMAGVLGIERQNSHVGMFTVEQCDAVAQSLKGINYQYLLSLKDGQANV